MSPFIQPHQPTSPATRLHRIVCRAATFFIAYAAAGSAFAAPPEGKRPNKAPQLTTVGAQTLNEDSSLTITLEASDRDSDPLIYSVTAADPFLNVTINELTVTISPMADFHGTGTFTVEVSDGADSATETIDVTVLPVNDAPVLTSPGVQSLPEDSTTDVTVSASDVDGDTLTYSLTDSTPELNTALVGNTITLTPDANFFGDGVVTLTVTDGELTATETFNVTVISENDAPVIAAIDTQSLPEDGSLTTPVVASDADGDELIFSIADSSPGITITIDNQELTITPDTDFFGTATATVQVSDGSLTDSVTFGIEITAVNDSPQLPSIAPITLSEDSLLNIALTASDPDGDVLTFNVVGFPEAGASVNGTTLTLAPSDNFNGSGVIEVEVTDGLMTVSQEVEINVVNVNDAPVLTSISNRHIPWDSDTLIDLVALDVDGDSLSFSAVSSDDTVVSLQVSGTTLVITPINNSEDVAQIVVTVSDGELSNDMTFDAFITNPVAFVPLRLQLDDTTLDDGGHATGPLDDIVLSATGGDGTYHFDVFYNGELRPDLLSDAVLKMPESGAFAGTYRLDVVDGYGNNAVFYIDRPLRVGTDVAPLLEASGTSRLIVTGAPAHTGITLHSDGDIYFTDASGTPVAHIEASDDTESFNATYVYLQTTGTGSHLIEVLIPGLPASTIEVDVISRREVIIAIQDTSEMPIAGASVTINDSRMAYWGLATTYISDSNGEVVLNLPSIPFEKSTDAPGYEEHVTELLQDQATVVITLQKNPMPYMLRGEITADGMSFTDEVPEVLIRMTDGSILNPELLWLNDKHMTFLWESMSTDLLPMSLSVTHSSQAPVEITLNPVNPEEVFSIAFTASPAAGIDTARLLTGDHEEVQTDEPTVAGTDDQAVTDITSGAAEAGGASNTKRSGGGGVPLWWILLTGIGLSHLRTRKFQQRESL
ncbi:MAG: tandem-95 repeat protein [Thalassolituus sp.]